MHLLNDSIIASFNSPFLGFFFFFKDSASVKISSVGESQPQGPWGVRNPV